MRRLLPVAALLLGGIAAEACPTKADLAADGITVEFDGREPSVFTLDETGAVIDSEPDGDTTYHYVSANGILETGYYETTKGADGKQFIETYTYSFDPDGIFPLEAGKTATGTQTATGPDLPEPDVVDYRYVVNAAETITAGGCTYDIIPVDTFYLEPDGIFVVVLGYLPDLGFAVLLADYDFGSDPVAYKITEFRAGT